MTQSTKKTLVLGGRGTVSQRVIQGLLEKGHRVRATSRDGAGGAAAENLEWVTLEVSDAESRRQAFRGVDKAFLLSPAGYVDQHALLAPLIAEAARNELQRVVLMTAMGVEHQEGLPFRKAERELEASGVTYNILRPNWFMQNFSSYWLHDIKARGGIFLPAEEAQVSFVDSRDISDMAAALLSDVGYANEAFTLTGPEALTHAQAAETLAKAVGRDIRYVHTEPAAFRAAMGQAGLPPDYVELLVMLFEVIRAGHAAPVSDAVEKVLGRKARSLENYAQEHRAIWAA